MVHSRTPNGASIREQVHAAGWPVCSCEHSRFTAKCLRCYLPQFALSRNTEPPTSHCSLYPKQLPVQQPPELQVHGLDASCLCATGSSNAALIHSLEKRSLSTAPWCTGALPGSLLCSWYCTGGSQVTGYCLACSRFLPSQT